MVESQPELPLTAASRCLLSNQIIILIARALYSNGDGKRSVANLGVACRSLHVAAMSVLWETMSGLAPLIRTLPRNYVCNYENVDDKPEDHMRTFVVVSDFSPRLKI